MSGYNSLFKICNYKLVLHSKHKDLEFFVTETMIPSITVGNLDIPYSSMQNKLPGDSLTYENLTTTIMIDEEMKVLDDIFSTLQLTHNPETNVYHIDPIILTQHY
jgi:hypothetical protein